MHAKYLLSIFIVITTSCNADGGCTVCCCLQVGFQALEDKTLVVSINSFLGYKDGQSRFMVSQKPQIPFSTLPAKSIHTGFAHSYCKLSISVIKISELIKNQVTYTLSDTGSCVHFMKLKVCMIIFFNIFIIHLTHTNVWESMGKPCSCMQFIKSPIFAKTLAKICIRCYKLCTAPEHAMKLND